MKTITCNKLDVLVTFAFVFALMITLASPVFAQESGMATFDYAPSGMATFDYAPSGMATFDYAPAGTATYDYAPAGSATFDYAPSGNAGTYNVNDINNYLPVGVNNGYGILGGPGTATFDYAPSAPGTATFDYAPSAPGTATFDYAPSQPGTATFDYAPKPGEVTFDYAPDYRTVDIYGVTPGYSYPYFYPGYGFGPSFGFGLGFSYSNIGTPVYYSSPVVYTSPTVVTQPSSVYVGPTTQTVTVNPVTQTTPQYAVQYTYPSNYSYPYVYASPATYTSTYVPPAQYAAAQPSAPYVALTQIPYTGYDFGPVGNALYWLSLVGFAAAGAYLLVYYLPALKLGSIGAVTLAGIGGRKFEEATPHVSARGMRRGDTSLREESPQSGDSSGTTDTMSVVKPTDGSAPRIVILRT